MSKKINIVIYTHQYPTPNNPATGIFTAQLAEELNKKANVLVVCPLPFIPWFLKLGKGAYSSLFSNIPDEDEFNGIPVYYPKFPVIPLISRRFNARLQALSVKPLLVRLKQLGKVDIVNAHFLYPEGVAAQLICSKLSIPTLLTATGSDINANENLQSHFKQIRWALNAADGVSGKSKALVSKMSGFVYDSDKVVFTPNGVNTSLCGVSINDRNKYRQHAGLSTDKKHLVFVGRLHKVKGVIYLLEAIKYLKQHCKLNFYTSLVGDGPLSSEFSEYIIDNQLQDDVQLTGGATHKEVFQWIISADAMCLPSLMEGMPNVILEAHACGVPTLATRVGGLPELVNDENGLLVKPEDHQSLANGLVKIFDQKWDKRRIISSIKVTSWEESADKYLYIMRAIVKSKIKN